VEGLDLSHVAPGEYHQICLPALYQGSDGAPIRCVLQRLSHGDHGGGGHSSSSSSSSSSSRGGGDGEL
jgi:hypothetical protein